jgi:Asp-tRNA(Asn)/Glu-tRNA(Gln) amidotransferase B subunit
MKDFADYLNEQAADSDTVQQAGRYYLAQLTDDLSPQEMKEELMEASADPVKLDALIGALEHDPVAAEQASLALLSSAWDDPREAERIQSIVDDAKGKLPVIETAIVAVVAVYGMYLIVTGGAKKTKKTVCHKKDGTFETVEVIEWAS